MARFQIGDRVTVTHHGGVREEGVVVGECLRREWDWWIQFHIGDPVPYTDDELELIERRPNEL